MSRQGTVIWFDENNQEQSETRSMDELEPFIMELQEQGINYQLIEGVQPSE